MTESICAGPFHNIADSYLLFGETRGFQLAGDAPQLASAEK
jgi:hypothetical protein